MTITTEMAAGVAQPKESDRIQCLECGRWFRALPCHLSRGHGLSVDNYRDKHGLPVGLPLVCSDWSDNQARHNVERDAKRTLTGRGPCPGFVQRDHVRRNRRAQYTRLAAAGLAAVTAIDRTATRREKLRPYPVTAAEAATRLGCSLSAARTFLAYCLARGKLARVGRGLYDEATADSLTASQPEDVP